MTFEYTSDAGRVLARAKRDLHDHLGDIVGESFRQYRARWEEVHTSRIITPFPLYLVLEQRFKCNLRCPMCVFAYPEHAQYRTDPAYMPDETFEKIMVEANQYGCPSISMNNTEEPLLNPQVFERIRRARQAGFVDIMMNTNATLLDEQKCEQLVESGLTRLLIGLDGFSKESYEAVRAGAVYENVVANVQRFLDVRERMRSQLPVVRLSFVINELNAHEVEPFEAYWRDRVDYIAFQEYAPPPVENPDLKALRSRETPEVWDCDQPWNRMTIRADGTVMPCCSFWGYHLPIGNVNEQSLAEIWTGPRMEQVRQSFLSQAPGEACRKCLIG